MHAVLSLAFLLVAVPALAADHTIAFSADAEGDLATVARAEGRSKDAWLADYVAKQVAPQLRSLATEKLRAAGERSLKRGTRATREAALDGLAAPTETPAPTP